MTRRILTALTLLTSVVLGAARADAEFLLVTESASNNLLRIDLSGGGPVVIAGSPALSTPTGVVLDASNNIYVANSATNTVRQLSPGGTDQGTFASTGLNRPVGLAFLGTDLLVTNVDSIQRFDSTGASLGPFTTSTNLDSPYGIAVGPGGFVYAANSSLPGPPGPNAGEVHQFSSAGTDLGTVATGLTTPTGVALDSAGNLYVSVFDEDRVVKLTSTGLGTFGAPTTFIGSVVAPVGLVFDSAGNLLVASQFDATEAVGTGSVFEYDASGNLLRTVASGLSDPAFLAITPVPEPGSLVLLGLGLAGGLIGRRRLGR